MEENQAVAQGILELLNLTHAMTGLGGSALTALFFGAVYKLTKNSLRDGLTEKEYVDKKFEDLEKEDLKELTDFVKEIKAQSKEHYENNSNLRDRVSTIEGELKSRST